MSYILIWRYTCIYVFLRKIMTSVVHHFNNQSHVGDPHPWILHLLKGTIFGASLFFEGSKMASKNSTSDIFRQSSPTIKKTTPLQIFTVNLMLDIQILATWTCPFVAFYRRKSPFRCNQCNDSCHDKLWRSRPWPQTSRIFLALKFDDSLLMFDEPKHTKKPTSIFKVKNHNIPGPKIHDFCGKGTSSNIPWMGICYISCQQGSFVEFFFEVPKAHRLWHGCREEHGATPGDQTTGDSTKHPCRNSMKSWE